MTERVFTDSQLRDLKTNKDPEVQALVWRLECAERCVELCATDENCCSIPELGPEGNVPDAISWLEAWRKSAGRE